MSERDAEANRFSARAARYARVGANVGGVAARIAATRLFNMDGRNLSNAEALAKALGGLKGPLMKVAQFVATIPDVVPPEYAAELQKLQSQAPPMGAAFVKRRMMAELGGKAFVIATGGFANTIAAESKLINVVEPFLTLDGLRILHERNSK